MLREIVHFVRSAPPILKMQKEMPRAEFFDAMASQADEQGYGAIRSELAEGLFGRVLDIGCGTGLMFRHYPAVVERVDAIEPEEDFRTLAERKAATSNGRISVAAGDAMSLNFPDKTFDAVVFGLVLCSVPSVERVVAEAFRVLRPGGQFRALEHVRSGAALGGPLMDLTNPLWLKLNKQGCNWNRDPVPAIRDAGFTVDDVNAFQRFDTVMPAFLMQRIRAHRA